MKRQGRFVALICMLCAALPAVAQTPRSFDVPAGDLIEGLQDLATQSGVDIVYPSDLLKGQKTHGVSGSLEPLAAFRKLLEGTSLAVREESGALLVTKVPDAAQSGTAQSSDDLLPQVEIEARRAKLSAMRAELERLEDQFFAAYNKLNDIAAFDVHCEREGPLRAHVCHPAFLERRTWSGGYPGGLYGSDMPSLFTSWVSPLDYRAHMVGLVSEHPELFELLRQRADLLKHYEVIRKQKFEGRIFVWD